MKQANKINLSKTQDPLEAFSDWIRKTKEHNELGNTLLNGDAINALITFGKNAGDYNIRNGIVDVYYPSMINPIRHMTFYFIDMPKSNKDYKNALGVVTSYQEPSEKMLYVSSGEYDYAYIGV